MTAVILFRVGISMTSVGICGKIALLMSNKPRFPGLCMRADTAGDALNWRAV